MPYIALFIIGLGTLAVGLHKVSARLGINAKYIEELDRTFDAAGISAIDADTSNGGIQFIGDSPEEIVLRATKEVRANTEEKAREFASQITLHTEQNGAELKIYKEHPKPPKGINVSIRYEIHGPTALALKLHTSNGKIQIDKAHGGVEAKTSNGSIDIREGVGAISLRTTNGKITLEDVSGQPKVETSNGSIHASIIELEGDGIFATSNGSVKVKVEKGNVPITAKTSNGSIDLTIPSDFSGQLDAKTSNGKVHTEFPIVMTVVGDVPKNQLSGDIGEGGEATVQLKTSNGSIHLKRYEQEQP